MTVQAARYRPLGCSKKRRSGDEILRVSMQKIKEAAGNCSQEAGDPEQGQNI